MNSLPLDGVVVVDLAPGPLAAVARHLVELGADVIRVEPRSGAGDRTYGPSVAGIGLGFVAANLGKRAVALDLADAADRARFETLLARADMLIEAAPPGSAEAAVLDVAGIRARHPTLVTLSVTPFGQDGPFAHWQVTDPVLHALTGELSRSGIPGRAPLLPPGTIALDCALVHGVYVLLLAYFHRLETGQGDRLDLALLDAAAQALDPGYGIAGSATAGVPASRLPRGRPEARFQYPIIPCADGHVRLCVLAPRQWQGMFEWMGRPEEFADPSFNVVQNRFASKTLIPAIARFFAGQSRADLEQAGQRHGVPTAALLDVDEALASEQMVARRAFVPVEIAPGITAPFPNGLMELDGRRAGIRGPAPTVPLDGDIALPPRAPAPNPVVRERPLEGLRVLDFGVIVVGAEGGRLLADQGADVIKIENAAFPDGSRQSRVAGRISPTFAAGHRNKLGLGLNLRDPEGKALLLRLIEQTDIILSNFKPGTLESLGLDHASLSAINPRLIMADSSAFGPSGPWSRRLGYGPLVRASAGLTAQWRYADDPESFSDAITVYPDHVAGRIGLIGVLALLIRRLRTGRGGTVSVSQAEVILSHMAPDIARRALARSGDPADSRPRHDAPWGVFACAGDDEHIVVTVRGDADWRALCGAIDRPDLLADATLASAVGRDAARERVDAALLAWLAIRDPQSAMGTLQTAGIPAGAMLRVSDLPASPLYTSRNFFRQVTHPEVAEPFYLETGPVRSERLPDPPERPAPLLGEHSAAIMNDRLGLAPDEIERLIAHKILEVPALT